MTFAASNIYHRGYRKGDVVDVYLQNGVTYYGCIYSHIRGSDNTAVFVHRDKPLFIHRPQIYDIVMKQKSPFRKRGLYRRKSSH